VCVLTLHSLLSQVSVIPKTQYKVVEKVYIDNVTRLTLDRHGVKVCVCAKRYTIIERDRARQRERESTHREICDTQTDRQ